MSALASPLTIDSRYMPPLLPLALASNTILTEHYPVADVRNGLFTHRPLGDISKLPELNLP